MKRKIVTIVSALLLGAALTLPAAADGERHMSVISLTDLKAQLVEVEKSVAGTMESLDAVKAAAKDGGLEKAAADFQNRFTMLESQVSLVRTQAVMVKARANEHFEAWQKELATVQNPKIREKAQSRFSESRGQFDKIIQVAQSAKEEALPFVSDLKDIVIYLQADTSVDAVKSLSNSIWKLGNKSKTVRDRIDAVTEQIDRTIASLPKN
jgi:hypothetical protein